MENLPVEKKPSQHHLAHQRTKFDEERTLLANERMMLSYIRTGLAFVGASIIIFKFFEDNFAKIVAYALSVAGILFFIIGIGAYPSRNKRIRNIRYRLQHMMFR